MRYVLPRDVLPREDVEKLLLDGHPTLGACAVLLRSDAALRKERDNARDWIKAANQFAWAHERSCPRHDADADVPCNCGLDTFLSRPRPYVESFKAQLAEVKAELQAVLDSF